uniref:Uncharacterized protein n=1 Tax=Rhipicephalus microplus TaxID=6941 RepID=A0A6G5A1W8_RHIMP
MLSVQFIMQQSAKIIRQNIHCRTYWWFVYTLSSSAFNKFWLNCAESSHGITSCHNQTVIEARAPALCTEKILCSRTNLQSHHSHK